VHTGVHELTSTHELTSNSPTLHARHRVTLLAAPLPKLGAPSTQLCAPSWRTEQAPQQARKHPHHTDDAEVLLAVKHPSPAHFRPPAHPHDPHTVASPPPVPDVEEGGGDSGGGGGGHEAGTGSRDHSSLMSLFESGKTHVAETKDV